MARTATRVDTQVKGGELILGGIVSGYFAGAANATGKITLKNASDAAQITFDAGQSGSGNYQIQTTGDVRVGGNLVIDGTTVAVDEVTIQSSAVITDNLTAGNAYTDSHILKGSVLFDVNTTNDVIVRESSGGNGALLQTQNAASGTTFSVDANSGNLYVGGTLTVASGTAASGAFNVYGANPRFWDDTIRFGGGQSPIVLEFYSTTNDGSLSYDGPTDTFTFGSPVTVGGLNTSTLTIGDNSQATATLNFDTTGADGAIVWKGSQIMSINANELLLGNSDATAQIVRFYGSAATGVFTYDSAQTYKWKLDAATEVGGALLVDGNAILGNNTVNAVSLTFDSSGASDEVITYTGSTDTLDSTAANYNFGDGATGDVSFSFDASNGPAVFKWDNAATGFDFDHKVKVNGDLWVTGSIVGPGNPVAGLAQYAIAGTSGTVAGTLWTLALADSALGNGLEDEAGGTYPIYLGPQGNWAGSEHLIPFTVSKNGLTLIYGSSEDYVLSKSGGAVRVTFSDAPTTGDRLRAVFSRQA